MKVKLKSKGERREKARYRSLPEHHTKREVIADRRGIQIDSMELGFLSQNIDPLHSPVPLRVAVERSFASLRLGRDRGLIEAQLLEVGLLPGPNPLVEVRMEFREQVSDRRGPMKVDGIRQTGMIEHDTEMAM
jgi:hypothetical protein